MENRLNLFEKGQHAVKTLFAMGGYLKKVSIGLPLQELIHVRVSQINQCAYCLDMHYKEARELGETEQRLFGLSAWREAPYYTAIERAALGWAEAVTQCEVSDALYAEAKKHFTDEELVDLTLSIAQINIWNRLNISFPQVAGTYRVGMF
jgi:AhpD family alkylhydroperoxidase